ncbi:PEP-CTERM sorting domain-containing protein [Rhodopila sp.]|uniref:PEP-CTERM sorting domain-containing protein n=1 Tax=Rhodopila sp. TaxID=2480087 RepID=UPI003D0BF92D
MRLNILVAALAVATATTAHAGTYEIDYTSQNPAIYGDVIVTASDTPAGGPFTVTGITGSRGTDTITALSSYAGSDQLVYAADPYFDLSGVSFSTASSGDFNLYTSNGSYYELSSNLDPVGYPSNGVPVSITISAVPEPASIAVLAVGILGLGVMLRSRRGIAATCT